MMNCGINASSVIAEAASTAYRHDAFPTAVTVGDETEIVSDVGLRLSSVFNLDI
jgi:hypothetical protein